MMMRGVGWALWMGWNFPLFPEQASESAGKVDAVFFALIGLTLAILLFLFGLLITFAVRYRAGSRRSRSGPIRKFHRFEVSWITFAFLLGLGLFLWGGQVYFSMRHAPENAEVYYVIGRQWMWEFRHPDGRRELNELHLPVGVPVKLVLESRDVIHSLAIPAFRVKMDAVPGKYTSCWFTPTRPGAYHLFCTEYCGPDHSRMKGTVYVMERNDYQDWLAGDERVPALRTLAESGKISFKVLGCNQCHRSDTEAIAPRLEGLYGREVYLRDGSTLVADEEYIRESILLPGEKVVRGYQPIMPAYQGQLTPEEVQGLVSAIRALSEVETVEDGP